MVEVAKTQAIPVQSAQPVDDFLENMSYQRLKRNLQEKLVLTLAATGMNTSSAACKSDYAQQAASLSVATCSTSPKTLTNTAYFLTKSP